MSLRSTRDDLEKRHLCFDVYPVDCFGRVIVDSSDSFIGFRFTSDFQFP